MQTEDMQTKENQAILEEYASKYPALLTVAQAAEIAQKPVGTVYDWSHRGYFDGIKRPLGREIRLLRDGLVRFMLDRSTAPSTK